MRRTETIGLRGREPDAGGAAVRQTSHERERAGGSEHRVFWWSQALGGGVSGVLAQLSAVRSRLVGGSRREAIPSVPSARSVAIVSEHDAIALQQGWLIGAVSP